ncbi:MAG: PadR family transcriptional regulator [Blastocatellia bacterium]
MRHKYLSFTMALILQALDNGYRYGFEIMQATGLASGTIYPALRRLEDTLLIKSRWEKQSIAQAEQRPARKYYEVTKAGREVLAEARGRFKLLEQVSAPAETELTPLTEEA